MLNIFLKIFRNRQKEQRLGSEYRFAFMLLHFNEGSGPKQGVHEEVQKAPKALKQ